MPVNYETGEVLSNRVRDRHHAKSKGEKGYPPSITEPNRVLSIAQLLQRYGADRLSQGAPSGVFNGDIFVPDFSRMDRIDKAQYAADLNDFVASERERIVMERQAAKAAEAAAAAPPVKEEVVPPRGRYGSSGGINLAVQPVAKQGCAGKFCPANFLRNLLYVCCGSCDRRSLLSDSKVQVSPIAHTIFKPFRLDV